MPTLYYEVQIPQSDGRSFNFSANLDGSVFNFEFRYNARSESWSFNLLDSANEPIFNGIQCVVQHDLLSHCPNIRRPDGKLYLIDTSGLFQDPGPFDLGQRVKMVYTSESAV